MYNPLTSTFPLPRDRHTPYYPVAMTELRILLTTTVTIIIEVRKEEGFNDINNSPLTSIG